MKPILEKYFTQELVNETRKLYEAGQIEAAWQLYKADPSAVQSNCSLAEFIEGMDRLPALRNQNLEAEALHANWDWEL